MVIMFAHIYSSLHVMSLCFWVSSPVFRSVFPALVGLGRAAHWLLCAHRVFFSFVPARRVCCVSRLCLCVSGPVFQLLCLCVVVAGRDPDTPFVGLSWYR